MKLLFVCTGNTCRSPMARAIFASILEDNTDDSISCDSAGLAAYNGEPAASHAILACSEIGLDISTHRAKSILDVNLNEIDRFIVMTTTNLEQLLSLGVNPNNVHILDGGVLDPYGCDLDRYRLCRDQIVDALLLLYGPFKEPKEGPLNGY